MQRSERQVDERARLARHRVFLTASGIVVIVVGAVALTGFLVVQRAEAVGSQRIDAALSWKITQVARRTGLDTNGGRSIATDAALLSESPRSLVVAIFQHPARGADGATPMQVLAGPSRTLPWPRRAIHQVVADAAAHDTGVSASTRTAKGIPLRLRALPVDEVGTRVIVVLAGVQTAWYARGHNALLQWTYRICGLLALLGALGTFLLARRVLRPLQMVLAQEDRLISSAVHELRQPLARLQAVSEEGLIGLQDPRAALRRAERVAAEVNQTISDLAEIASLARGHKGADLRPMRLDEVVREVLDHRADEARIHLDLEEVQVFGCPGLIRRAVVNLVDNSIRHGRRQGKPPHVWVSVGPGFFRVEDDGPGVDPVQLERMFATVNAAKFDAGLGMGLTIVGWVVRLHRGRLRACNRATGGLSVTVTLPTERCSPALVPARVVTS